MKRLRILREGIEAGNGFLIPRGGVTLEAVIPIIDKNSVVIGSLGALRREHDGWVTGIPSLKLPAKVALAANIIPDKGAELTNLTGRLVSAGLTETPTWPGMFP